MSPLNQSNGSALRAASTFEHCFRGINMQPMRKTSLDELTLKTYTDKTGVETKHLTFYTSAPEAPEPLQVGYFEMTNSNNAMIFQHKFEEGKYVIEGEIVLVDVDTREVMVAKKGDMLHLPTGSSAIYWTPSYAKVFFCSGSDEIVETAFDSEIAVTDVPELCEAFGLTPA
ncbi:cupin domain-containing protein [Celeribacter naphthalenivorans]|uniref:hypothetical protein n=1 Tax=Celeribacter naphthalenivorans TaxID=1614694 RepID=UPI001CF9B5E9|nr:hypothetical protein [Celeribacter naphthalenivorans]